MPLVRLGRACGGRKWRRTCTHNGSAAFSSQTELRRNFIPTQSINQTSQLLRPFPRPTKLALRVVFTRCGCVHSPLPLAAALPPLRYHAPQHVAAPDMPPPTPPCPTRAGAGAEAACWRPRPHGAGRCRCGPLGHCHGVQRRRDGAHRPPQGPVKPRSSRRLSTAAWAVAAVVALCGVRQASALLVDYTGAHFNTRSTEYRNCKITQR